MSNDNNTNATETAADLEANTAGADSETAADLEAGTADSDDSLSEEDHAVNEYIALIDNLFDERGFSIERGIDYMTYSKGGEELFTIPYSNDIIMARFYKENEELRKASNVDFHAAAFEKYCPEAYEVSLDTIPGDMFSSFIASWATGKLGAPSTGE